MGVQVWHYAIFCALCADCAKCALNKVFKTSQYHGIQAGGFQNLCFEIQDFGYIFKHNCEFDLESML